MGLFSKEGVAKSPGMTAYEDAVIQNSQHYEKTWAPLTAFFRQENDLNQEGVKTLGEGRDVAAADLAARQVSEGITAKDEARGAAPGSGAFTADIQAGGDNTASARARGLTEADASAKSDYLKAVSVALGQNQAAANIGLQGMSSAANQEQSEAALAADINNSRMAMVGQIAGGLIGMAGGGGGGMNMGQMGGGGGGGGGGAAAGGGGGVGAGAGGAA